MDTLKVNRKYTYELDTMVITKSDKDNTWFKIISGNLGCFSDYIDEHTPLLRPTKLIIKYFTLIKD